MKKTLLLLELWFHYEPNKKVKVNVSIHYWPLVGTRDNAVDENLQLQLLLLSLRTWKVFPIIIYIHHKALKKPLAFLSPQYCLQALNHL